MTKSSIRNRLIFLFVLQIVLVLFLSGWYLQWHLRNVLEQELSEKLQAIATTIASQLETDLVLELMPGDESTRNYANLRQALVQIQSATRMKRLFIFDRHYRSLLDTDTFVRVGFELPRLKVDLSELDDVFNGNCTSSVLFIGNDGLPYKTGYAPMVLDGEIVGGIGVDGSAASLEVINDIRKNLIRIGLIAMLLAGFLALFFSNRLTLPLRKLQTAAQCIGRGDLTRAIEIRGSDEIAFLGRTLEEMRRGILTRDARQKQMLASVAHEIRNPLGGIELFTGLLIEELAQQKPRQKAEKILREVSNLKTLIQNFLDYARPVTPKRQKCRVNDCWQEVQSLLSKELTSKNITVRANGDGIAFVDSQQLKQVFLNLAVNSINAIPENGIIEVNITTNSNSVCINFADNGIGIKPGDRERIFEPFFTTTATGTGLGLSIVKNLVEANGGRINLAEYNSENTTFEIILPCDHW